MRKLTLFLLLVAGCSSSSRYMVKDETPEPLQPPSGEALIAFVRPGGLSATFTVIDDKGNYIGQIPTDSHVLHATAPAHYRYIVWAENTSVLDADVAAGKTYIVEVAPRMGMWSARAHLLPVKRGGKDWDKAPQWVQETTQWDVDPDLAKQWTEEKRDGIVIQLQRAKEMWAKYDEEDKEKRTMRPDDGR
jgi:hypothetical protein